MINLLDLDLDQLEQVVLELGEPRFRAKQIYQWMNKGVTKIDDMTNLPKTFKAKLKEIGDGISPEILQVQESKLDGTKKYLFRLEDGYTVESVFMKYKYGNSVCISSQVGCKMGCKFCASTIGGLKRNMTAGEMMGQVIKIAKETKRRISHIVVMGIGEPFDNYDNVSRFIKMVHHKEGLNIGLRNITVSTCGIVPMIEKFGDEFPQVNLAISLHQHENGRRSTLMPINRKYPLEELIKVGKAYTEKTSRRITFEYTLVKGENDSLEDSNALGKLLNGMLCHVNLIPLNLVEETGLRRTDRRSAVEFKKNLEKMGIPVTIRRELGDDIDGACGQLRLKEKGKR